MEGLTFNTGNKHIILSQYIRLFKVQDAGVKWTMMVEELRGRFHLLDLIFKKLTFYLRSSCDDTSTYMNQDKRCRPSLRNKHDVRGAGRDKGSVFSCSKLKFYVKPLYFSFTGDLYTNQSETFGLWKVKKRGQDKEIYSFWSSKHLPTVLNYYTCHSCYHVDIYTLILCSRWQVNKVKQHRQ